MKALLSKIEKVNGFGWFIGMLVQVVYTTVAVTALYFGIVRKNDAILAQVNHNAYADSVRSAGLEEEIKRQSARVGSLWRRAQAEHREMMRRVGVRWDTHEE